MGTIPKQLNGGGNLVAICKKDFEKFKKWQNEISDALVKVKRGRQEFRTGKTRIL